MPRAKAKKRSRRSGPREMMRRGATMISAGEADRGSLWRHGDFLKLWAAQAVSSFGARITREGLPYAAVMSLGADPAQLGLLAALTRGPAIIVGLGLGGFVDRRSRRGVMIGDDIGRAVILASVPVAAWSHLLSLGQIYAVAALVGALSVLFEMADHAYLPTLVAGDQLVDGGSKLAATDAVAEIGGPALYGLLFQLFTAPVAIAVNAGTYLFSAAALGLIGKREAAPEPRTPVEGGTFIEDFRAGLAVVLRDPALRTLLLITTTNALFVSFFAALYIVWAVRSLGLSPAMLGATVAVGGVSALAGAAITPRLVRTIGLGRAYVLTNLVGTSSTLLIALAGGGPASGMAMLMISQVIGDSVGTVAEIASRTLRQTLVAPELMGRVGGVFATAPGVTGIIGALAGGGLAGVIGLRPTLLVASLGLMATAAIGLGSPLTRAMAAEET